MSARTDAAALRDAVAETRRVLRGLNHDVTGDLACDVDRAIDRERERRESVLSRVAVALGDDPTTGLVSEDDIVNRVAASQRALVALVDRLDPPDAAGIRRRIDELAARAFGPAYDELCGLIRGELRSPSCCDDGRCPWCADPSLAGDDPADREETTP